LLVCSTSFQRKRRGAGMADVFFVVLTIAVFVILGLVVRAVERL
jgi:hypothetical protein